MELFQIVIGRNSDTFVAPVKSTWLLGKATILWSVQFNMH